MRNLQRFLFASTVLLAIIFGSVPRASACGPFYEHAKFSLVSHGDYPLTDFADGRPGIVPASFRAMSLVGFYRQLNGAPLSKSEQTEFVHALETQIFYLSSSRATKDGAEPDALAKWHAARAKVIGGKTDVAVDKQVDGGYQWITNCLPDAFGTAAKTLDARIAEHGNGDAVREWLKGQDAVFANCDEASTPPSPLDAAAPEWLRRDRAYQIAATMFYRGDFAGARADFEAIANDADSPWSRTARFVAARTLIREANLSGGSVVAAPEKIADETRDRLFKTAVERLEAILADQSMREFHGSANRLIGLVKYRTAPATRRPELAAILASAQENTNLYNDLTDYSWLLDPVFAAAEEKGAAIESAEAEKAGKRYDYNYVVKLRDVPAEVRADELTDWIFTFKAADGFEHALERWKSTGRLPWFVAAISKAAANSPSANELIAEAARIPSDSPAAATVRYHQIRLLLESRQTSEARKMLDEVLTRRDSIPVSSLNKFLALRLSVATSLDEFLKFAPRKPAIIEWDGSDREEENNFTDEGFLKTWQRRALFDNDAVAFINEKMPLSMIRRAAVSRQLPDHLKRFLAIAGWTRAFVVGDRAAELEFTPLVRRYVPEFKTYFSKYVAANGETDREAAALIVVLRYPVIQPYVPVGLGREGAEAFSIDSNRGNWWCSKSTDDGPVYDVWGFEYPSATPAFLTAPQVAAAQRERDRMSDGGNSSTYLARRVVEFANRFPNHPKTPELLHLAVRSTRFGCGDENTGKYSKLAFDLLHKRYPASVWTEKTPYWFGQ